MYKFKFADIGEGLHEGTVAEIYKKVGDTVKEGDSLISVETDKVTSDIPSPVSGTITKMLFEQGDVIHVGNVIYHIDDGSGDDAQEEEVKEEKVEEAGASVVGEVKVSNELFTFGNFGSKKPSSKPKPPVVRKPRQTQGSNTFDIDSITATGNGEKVDAVVIGAGPGGYTVTEQLARAGYKTICVEKESAGGVCLNVGCIPTKTLLKSAAVLEYIEKAEKYGINIDIKTLSLNWNKMQERKEDVRKKLVGGVEFIIKSSKAQLVKGEAEIIDKHNVKVGDKVFTTKIIVLATGSTPVMLPLEGFEDAAKKGILIDSTDALSLTEIPKSFVVIGGGVIGTEFATLYATLGSKVTIIEGLNSILGPLDDDIKKFSSKEIEALGVKVITNAKVTKMDGTKVIFEVDGKEESVDGEKVLLSVGRRPNNISVDKILGVEVDRRGAVIVNEHMQTNVPNIFAIGDVVGKSMLAHTAYKHAHVVADTIKKLDRTWDINKVPACVYIHPEIAMIGKTEQQLKEEGIEYIKSVWQNANVGKALADGDTRGFTKLLISPKHGEILGAHIINNHASDMIAEIAAVMELEGTVYELAATIHPHPSISEVIYEAAVTAVHMLEKRK